ATVLRGLNWGIWGVDFNLYLKEIGFQDDFVGYMASASMFATGFVAVPAGMICEKIGRKKSFLFGTMVSSLFGLVQLFALNSSILLIVSLAGGIFGTISWVAGAPFMMESTHPEERSYLFSVNWGLSTVSSVVGNVLGGELPRTLGHFFSLGPIPGYRMSLVLSLAFSLSSLIPLYLIREKIHPGGEIAGTFSLENIQSLSLIAKFALTSGLIGLGAGFIVPLFNVFFQEKLGATTEQIGLIFALGSIALALGTFVAPAISNRLSKVKAVFICRSCSIPFIFAIVLVPHLGVAALSYLLRGALMNMAGPIDANFMMERVQETERATTSGFTVMADNIPRAISVMLAGQLMKGGNYWIPYFCTGILYSMSSILYLLFFRGVEKK
ncbi:MFS transporter, partial [Candidatus Bathyarchaeota archaeon]|nr:MFS transporter [Candidatus Bathyarchaeota archaeon]NIR15350.1 MFS transporter [Desulfobacterales bacterium]NIU81817.1 MFS transporter [Candidatus Bathyarchaeota archaeon]NIV68131.1 MFS transporter [Candidatus Bathyarchaeota archaeon]NIW16046.1 MFS transporter [Candidatus Bathyarchaeota archaeon]